MVMLFGIWSGSTFNKFCDVVRCETVDFQTNLAEESWSPKFSLYAVSRIVCSNHSFSGSGSVDGGCLGRGEGNPESECRV